MLEYITLAVSGITLLSVWRIPSKLRAEARKIKRHVTIVSAAKNRSTDNAAR